MESNLVDGPNPPHCARPSMRAESTPLRTGRLVAGVFLLVAMFFVNPMTGAENAADVAEGRKLFQALCVNCHGHEAAGGSAPSLNRPVLEGAPDDDALRSVIANGIPGRGMPRVRRMADNELRQFVSYLHSLRSLPPPPSTANADQGRLLYNQLGCATCHMVKGEGGNLGPDLTAIGRMRGPAYLKEAVLTPAAVLPNGTLRVSAQGYDEYLPVLVVTSDGREVKGVRLNEDSFTIQLRDPNGQIHSFRKSTLTRLEKLRGTSLMPPDLAKNLSPAEVDDLIGFLANLRGTP